MAISRRWALVGLMAVGLAACGETRANIQGGDSPDYSGEAGSNMFRPGCDTTGGRLTSACSGDR